MRYDDYLKEFKEVLKAEKSLSTRLNNRILELSKIHPEAIIIKGGRYKAEEMDMKWLNNLELGSRLLILQRIEMWSNEKENVVQKKMEI
jgi:hypothetical protein